MHLPETDRFQEEINDRDTTRTEQSLSLETHLNDVEVFSLIVTSTLEADGLLVTSTIQQYKKESSSDQGNDHIDMYRRWTLVGICSFACLGLIISSLIIFALIPLYISSRDLKTSNADKFLIRFHRSIS